MRTFLLGPYPFFSVRIFSILNSIAMSLIKPVLELDTSVLGYFTSLEHDEISMKHYCQILIPVLDYTTVVCLSKADFF